MQTIVEVVEDHLEKNKIDTIFTYLEDGENREQKLSLAEMRSDALKFTKLLAPGETALVLLPQGIQFIKAFFGCLYAQAIAVPATLPSKNRGFEKLRGIIDDAGISVGITNLATLANLSKWFPAEFPNLRVRWLLMEEIEERRQTDSSLFTLPAPGQTAFLQYTSGSTGRPKAVIISHENIIANSKIIRQCFQNDAESASVCWLPSFHDMGLIDGIIQPVFTGFHGVLMSPVHFLQKPVRWLRAITRYGATYSGGPNFAFDLCANRVPAEELAGIDLSGLNCLYNGSEPIRPRTLENFVERFSACGFSREKFFTCYGLAEATLAVTASKIKSAPTILKVEKAALLNKTLSPAPNKPGVELVGCGRVHGDTRLKIVEPESSRECGPMEIGEIWVAGRSVAAGYWNAQEAGEENFVEAGGERYFKTGDLGFFSDGELFVTGRLKDLIIIRGKNHYPQDLEQTVSTCHEALQVNAAATFSVEAQAEEKLVVVQEIKRERLKDADFTVIFSSMLAHLSRIHGLVPHEVVLLYPANLPKTTSGKIQRSLTRQLWFEKKLNALAVWSAGRSFEVVTYENTAGNNFMAANTDSRRN